MPTRLRARSRALPVALATGMLSLAPLVPALSPAASAATAPSGTTTVATTTTTTVTTAAAATTASAAPTAAQLLAARGRKVLAVAARYRGIRYHAGGTRPSTGFDCSGYVGYVFRRLGIHLPRTSYQMAASVRRISRSQAVPGDLVFFRGSSGRVHHVGIYAGHNMIWHAPYPGQRVKLERIWSSRVSFGRVR